MKYQHIFFDLDGTLTDSADGIVNSVRYALEKQGIVPPAREQLLPFVGPPLLDSFHKYYGMDREQGMQAIKAYREYFTDRGWKENSVYEGIPEVLKQLKDAGASVYCDIKAGAVCKTDCRNILDWTDILTGSQVLP